MTTAYTSLLGLALPVTGELSGVWGDTVNNSITTLLDSAIAGTQTITADTTLTTTTGSANTSRQAILLCSPASANITITAPAQSKIYTVINTSATYTVTVRGAGPTTGVILGVSEKAVVAWNGSDFVKVSNTTGDGTFANLTVTGNTSLGNADTDTITQAASYVTGTQLKSAKTDTNTLSLAAYDVDGTAYTDLITLTASNTPTLALTSTGVGTINNMSIGATTASTGAFTTLSATGNVTLGDATTDTVTVNGYMGVGGAASPSIGVRIQNTALTSTSQDGIQSAPVGTSAATTQVRAFSAQPSTAAAAFTCASVYGFRALNAVLGAGSTITNQYGFYVDDQTQGTNNYGITSLVSSGTNKWNIYASGTANNYFAGNVGIGTATVPSVKLEVAGTASTTLVKNTTTTAANGFNASSTGGNFYFGIDSSTNNFYSTGTPYGRAIYSEGAYPMVFFTNATERMRIDSSGVLNVDMTGTETGATNGFQFLSPAGNGGLTIYSSAAIRDQITFKNSVTTGPASGTASAIGVASGAMTFKTGGSDRMTITSAGNVGIAAASNAYNFNAANSNTTTGASQYSIGVTATLSGTTFSASFLSSLNIPTGITAVSAAGLRIVNPTLSGTGAITNCYGIYIDDQTSGASDYGIRSLVSSGTNKFNLYIDGTAANYFAGNVLVGEASAGVGGLSVSNVKNINFVESATTAYATIFRQASSAALTLNYGYAWSSTASSWASSIGSATARSSIAVGAAFIRFYTDASSTVAVGTNITPTLRATIDSVGNLQVQTGAVMPYAPAPASISTTATLTNANIQAQIINTTGTTYTVTMPLGTTLETLASWMTTGIGYDFYIVNTASGTITLDATEVGVTSVGTMTIATGVSAQFRIRRTAANTFVVYRLC